MSLRNAWWRWAGHLAQSAQKRQRILPSMGGGHCVFKKRMVAVGGPPRAVGTEAPRSLVCVSMARVVVAHKASWVIDAGGVTIHFRSMMPCVQRPHGRKLRAIGPHGTPRKPGSWHH